MYLLYLTSFWLIYSLQYNKHLFVHIGQTNHSYSDALLESVDIRQIYDKFPEKKGGLKELYGKGRQNSFFLIKFWVSIMCKLHLWVNIKKHYYSLIMSYTHQSHIILTLSTPWVLFSNCLFRSVFCDWVQSVYIEKIALLMLAECTLLYLYLHSRRAFDQSTH